MRLSILGALCALTLPSAHAWDLQGSVWAGADQYDNIGYSLVISSAVKAEAPGFWNISGTYQSGFDDQGECKDDGFRFVGSYYEPEAVMSFTVDWYNSHNPACRTVSAYTGYIYTDSDMKMRNLYVYPNQKEKHLDSWIINWERQVP